MADLEQDLYEDLAYEEAEGAADFYEEGDEFDEIAFEEEGFEDEDEWEGAEAYFDEDDDFEAADEYAEYDEFDEADSFDEEEAEDELDGMMAYALSAEDADEFFKKLWRGIKKFGKKAIRVARKAAPVIGKIARVAAPILSKIPHPAAQIAGRAASLLGRLRAEGASEEEALEAFAELAVHNRRALPVVAGLTARSVLKSQGARMSFPARKKAVKDIKAAAKTLVRRRGPKAIRALPKIARSVKRTAMIKGTPARARPMLVRRTIAKVAQNPTLVRKLSKPSPTGVRLVKKVAVGGGGRSFTIPGPTRITITAV